MTVSPAGRPDQAKRFQAQQVRADRATADELPNRSPRTRCPATFPDRMPGHGASAGREGAEDPDDDPVPSRAQR